MKPMLMGAMLGAGTSLVTGKSPLKGAIIGGLGGGLFGGSSGFGSGFGETFDGLSGLFQPLTTPTTALQPDFASALTTSPIDAPFSSGLSAGGGFDPNYSLASGYGSGNGIPLTDMYDKGMLTEQGLSDMNNMFPEFTYDKYQTLGDLNNVNNYTSTFNPMESFTDPALGTMADTNLLGEVPFKNIDLMSGQERQKDLMDKVSDFGSSVFDYAQENPDKLLTGGLAVGSILEPSPQEKMTAAARGAGINPAQVQGLITPNQVKPIMTAVIPRTKRQYRIG